MRSTTRHLLTSMGACLLLVLGAGVAVGSVNGPDVSSYQHPQGYNIDWQSVHASGGATFGFVKATEGAGYTNPYFASDFAAMASANMVRGAYHFAQPATSAVAQADYFVQVAGTLSRVGDLPPVLDLEVTGGLTPPALIAWTQAYLQEIKRLTGRDGMIYTGPYFWQTAMANSTAFTGYPLWVATYGSAPQLPGGWTYYTFWQYTDAASVPGIQGSVDMSVFNGTTDNLMALANGASAPSVPFGSLDAVTWTGSALAMAGWAIDPDTTAPITVSVSVDGATVTTATAGGARADVASAYPAFGPNHGYNLTFQAAPGPHQVCVMANNVGAGSISPQLGCRTVTVPVPLPMGSLDGAGWTGSALGVAGWAIDPDTTLPITVSVTVDGNTATTAAASAARPDVAAAYPGYGPDHGYNLTLPAAPGPHQVCVTANNVGAGTTSPQLGCRTVTVPTFLPIGSLDGAGWTGSALGVAGWAIDPDTTLPITVSVSVDGHPATTATAGTARPDIARYYPAYGPNHGYSLTVPAAPGPHQVCVTANNVGAGTVSPQLGCRTVNVPTSTPIGSVDGVGWTGSALGVAGWTIDPDTAAPINVAVSVDGRPAATATASAVRTDVARYYPGYGPNHGYSLTVPAAPGLHQVCVTAINMGAGTISPQLGCRTVNVPTSVPIGSVDGVGWTGTALGVAGWTIDPDTAAPITVTVSVDGHAVTTATASSVRTDVARYYPGYGPDHGYALSLPATRGTHQVCVTANNSGAGTISPQLGCRTVTLP